MTVTDPRSSPERARLHVVPTVLATAAARAPGVGERAARAVLLALLGRMPDDALELHDADGVHRAGRGRAAVAVVVHDPAAYLDVVRRGGIGLGDSYRRGCWDAADLPGLVAVLARNVEALDRLRGRAHHAGAPVLDRLRRLRRPDPGRDRANVRAHYDLGNELFALVLDETMTYSAAVFDDPSVSLRDAQVAKLDRICRKLGLAAADHVVEIGTGWGSFAIHAASTYGCRVTTTTVSAEQHAFARERVAEAGVADLVEVRHDDYRDLRGRHDALVSIEMIEAVDWRDHDAFLGACTRLLRSDGRMALQAIVVPDRRYERARVSRDFIKAMIFPGGCLPSVGAIVGAAARTGDLGLVDLEDLGPHYAETLARWRANLDERLSAADLDRLGLDEAFRRLFRFYFAYCEGAFRARHVSVVQAVLARSAWRAGAPGTRPR